MLQMCPPNMKKKLVKQQTLWCIFWFNTTCYIVNLMQSMMHNIHILWQHFCYLLGFFGSTYFIIVDKNSSYYEELLWNILFDGKNRSVWILLRRWKSGEKQFDFLRRWRKKSFNVNKNFMTNSQDPPRIVAPKTKKIFGFPIFQPWGYLIEVIQEMCCAH